MKKKNIFRVSWMVFPFDVLVCLGSTRCEVLAKIEKLGYQLDDEERSKIVMFGKGRTVILKRGQTILWLNKRPKKGDSVLAHEIFHAVAFILDRIGIPMEPSCDELPAYMIQYLTEEINDNL